jgi:hypothetical protein
LCASFSCFIRTAVASFEAKPATKARIGINDYADAHGFACC